MILSGSTQPQASGSRLSISPWGGLGDHDTCLSHFAHDSSISFKISDNVLIVEDWVNTETSIAPPRITVLSVLQFNCLHFSQCTNLQTSRYTNLQTRTFDSAHTTMDPFFNPIEEAFNKCNFAIKNRPTESVP